MNSNWHKWVMTSVIRHFKTGLNVDPNYLWVIGEKLDTKKAQRFELRYLGPTFISNPGEYQCRLSLNVVVRSNIDSGDQFNHLTRVGLAQSMFANCLRIYKFGPISGVDTGEQFDQMRLSSEISTANYGQIDLTDNVVISTVEADYIGDFRI